MTDIMDQSAQSALNSVITRVENLEKDRADINDDIKQVYEQAKTTGLDTKIIRKIIARRREDPEKIQEEEALLELYMDALNT